VNKMQDEQLKELLLNEPVPKMSKQFSVDLLGRLDMLQGDVIHVDTSKNMMIALKRNYWQYLIMGLMIISTLTILNLHQKTDHVDDELSRIDLMTELTLSTL
jgi:hypothetical protein